jgi:post-segregation antitoxin (ccd killing protein)
MKKHSTFRLDPDLLAEARRLGLNVTALIENALSQTVKKKKCPTCGQMIKKLTPK